jgi:hypothetical protein
MLRTIQPYVKANPQLSDMVPPTDAMFRNLQAEYPAAYRRLASGGLRLHDDGVAPDVKAGDGIYSAEVTAASAGHMKFFFSATGTSAHGGAFQRQQLVVTHVRAVPDKSYLNIEESVADDVWTIVAKPRTKVELRMGPGFKHYLVANVRGTPAVLVPEDRLDGSYAWQIALGADGKKPKTGIHFIMDTRALTDADLAAMNASELAPAMIVLPPDTPNGKCCNALAAPGLLEIGLSISIVLWRRRRRRH